MHDSVIWIFLKGLFVLLVASKMCVKI